MNTVSVVLYLDTPYSLHRIMRKLDEIIHELNIIPSCKTNLTVLAVH